MYVARKRKKKNYARVYFRYESMEEIEAKLREGQVLSGLTTMKDETDFLEDHLWLVFGKNGSKVSIIPPRQIYDGKSDALIGFSYHQYELEKETVFDNMDTEYLTQNTSDYCIMLPFVEKKKATFSNQYAVVFDNWDVIDEHGEKTLPTLCWKEFRSDVKKD